VSAWCSAMRLWEVCLEADPLGSTASGVAAGQALRRGLLEAGACVTGTHSTCVSKLELFTTTHENVRP